MKLEGKVLISLSKTASAQLSDDCFYRGIPNNIILGKMERVLGVKLRGKDIGNQFVPPPSTKK
jgi:hypothetical protein